MAFIGNTNITQGFIPAIDYFNGNGSTVAFTLSRPVASVAQVQANISNVPQNPSSAFSVSGNTITFTSAPPSGTNNIYVYYTSPITQVIAPSQGTVGTTQLQNGLVVNFADGSAASPSITNDGDTNTGIFFPAADTIGFAEGGTEVARFNADAQFVAAAGTASLPVITTTGDTNTGIFFPAADTIGFAEGGTEAMRIDSAGRVGVGTTNPTAKQQITSTSAGAATVGLFLNNVSDTSSTEIRLAFAASSNDDIATNRYSYISLLNTAGNNSGTLVFATNASGASATEKMRIDSSGNLLVGTTAAFTTGDVNTGGTGGVYVSTESGSAPTLTLKIAGGNGVVARFIRGGISAPVGNISITTTATAYNTSSDYRLKNTIAPMTGALAKVSALKPVTYKWNADGSDGQGFIAHELAEVEAGCVTGEKDAVDDEGNPVYQGIDTSFLVATLTAAIKEQQAIITSLTDRITLLENK
jgi:hypothetical protein